MDGRAMTASPPVALVDRSRAWPLAAAGLGLVLLAAVGSTLHHSLGGAVFYLLIAGWAATAAWASRAARDVDQHRALWLILLAAAAMRLALLTVHPYLSTDVWRYVWDGRVQAAGTNPYRYVPAAPELFALRDPVIYPGINRASYAPTVYPPAAQIAFLLITRFGETVTVMRLGMVAFEAVTIFGLVAILRRLGRKESDVVAYAWHPLPVWEIAGNGHVDAVMVAFLVLGLWATLVRRELLAAGLVTIGALAKPLAVLALPLIWRPWNWRLVVAVAATVVALYLPYVGAGALVIGFLPGYIEEERIASGERFWLLRLAERFVHHGDYGVLVYAGIAAAAFGLLCLLAAFRRDRTDQTTIDTLLALLLAFLILLSPRNPWYFLVATPFVALSRAFSPWVATLGAVFLYDVIPGDTTIPVYSVREALFFSAVIAALAFDVLSGRVHFFMNSGAQNP
jgi:hypothetical protein